MVSEYNQAFHRFSRYRTCSDEGNVKFLETLVIIRKMKEEDLDVVSAVCMDSLLESVVSTLSAEGVSTFSNIAACNAFLKRMNEDNLMLVAECDGKVEGVIELKKGRHIAMLFVHPKQQNRGIGGKLVSSALGYARVGTVTVKASLSSVPAYEKYGFKSKGEIGESAGLVYQPMEFELNKPM